MRKVLQHGKVLMSKQPTTGVCSRIHFTSTSWDSCQDYPGRSYDVLRCVLATFIALEIFWSPWKKNIREISLLSTWDFQPLLPLPRVWSPYPSVFWEGVQAIHYPYPLKAACWRMNDDSIRSLQNCSLHENFWGPLRFFFLEGTLLSTWNV